MFAALFDKATTAKRKKPDGTILPDAKKAKAAPPKVAVPQELSKSQRKKLKKKQKQQGQQHQASSPQTATTAKAIHEGAVASKKQTTTMKTDKGAKGASKKMSLTAKMQASQFRNLNETLYTSESKSAWDLFQQEPALFTTYHAGFREQVEKWPTNPVDIFIQFLKTSKPNLVVADFGCGEAAIAASVRQKVHSFDLAAVNDKVTACDMSNVPLKDKVVDVAIFSLALMGKNYEDFVREASRVLKIGGVLKIAEVVSRFTSVSAFENGLMELGFKVTNKDMSGNTHFFLLDAVKISECKATERVLPELKPCIYKRR